MKRNHPTHRFLVIGICVPLWIVISTPMLLAQAVSRIELRPSVSVNGHMIRLKDIADIHSDDSKLLGKLGAIEIVRAPLAGQTRWIMPTQVQRRLAQNGVNASQYRLSDTGPSKVTRRVVPLKAVQIRQAVKAYIQRHAPWKPEQMTIGAIKFNRPVDVPPGKVGLIVNVPKHSDWLGAIPFRVDVKVNGRKVRKITVPVNLEVWSNVVVAAKPLGKYQPITSHTIKVKKMNLARVPATAITNADDIVGKRAKRNIAVNSILRSDQIEMPPVVQRGDMVQAVAESPAMKVSVQAVVKENGGKGEMIRVLNLRSKKIVYAKVLDAQTVSVEFQRR